MHARRAACRYFVYSAVGAFSYDFSIAPGGETTRILIGYEKLGVQIWDGPPHASHASPAVDKKV